MRELIVDRLKKIYGDNIRSFYVPGHKHGRLLDKYLLDVRLENLDFTEIEGTDNLHNAHDIIARAQENASRYYNSKSSYFLVNGTTGGILSAISSVGSKGDKILTTRDCHKSVYNAMAINDYEGIYVDINYDNEFDLSIGPNYCDYSKKLLANTDVKAVVLTYPTYNGICYDIGKFIELAHMHNIIVIVDEAHGGHLRISDKLAKSALDLGADIVIQSSHKMIPSFTQSSIIHFKSSLMERRSLEKYLKIYQSSSPSYLLMASIDMAIDIIESEGRSLLDNYLEMLKEFYDSLNLKYFKNVNEILEDRYGVFIDPFKINIGMFNEDINLNDLEEYLRKKYNLQCEYSNRRVSLFISSIATEREDMELLKAGLRDFGERIFSQKHHSNKEISSKDISRKEAQDLRLDYSGVYKKSLYEALKSDYESVDLEISEGRIAAEMITPYPPGIPYILPGELISKRKLDNIKDLMNSSIDFEGIIKEEKRNVINVIRE